MLIESTPIKDLLLIKSNVFTDHRGYFTTDWTYEDFKKNGLDFDFVQDSRSFSKYGVLRGMHYQSGNSAQAKLVRVIKGKVLDVAVDLRRSSATFGQHFSVELDESNNAALLIPRGFAHGFVTLSSEAIFCYKVDNFYNKSAECGLNYDDESLKIDWKIDKKDIILSEKDTGYPSLKNATMFD